MSREYPDRPFVGVGLVVWRDEKFLLIQRGKAPRYGTWSLPGGRQKLGETVREAGLREIKEETDLDVEITHLIDVVDSLTRDDDDRVRFHYTLVDFTAEWRGGTAKAGSDAAGVRWVHPDELGQFELWDETVRIIRMSADQR